MLERLDLGMLHWDRKRRAGQHSEVVVAEFVAAAAAAAAAATVGHVHRENTQQIVVSVVVVVGDEVAVAVAVAVEAVAGDNAFAKSVGTVSVRTEGTVPHRRAHRKLALAGMHMRGRVVAVVQVEAGIVVGARPDADKHYWDHTHMAGVVRNRIRRVVDLNHTLRCDAQGCLPLFDQISCVLSQRTRSLTPNQLASDCTCQ